MTTDYIDVHRTAAKYAYLYVLVAILLAFSLAYVSWDLVGAVYVAASAVIVAGLGIDQGRRGWPEAFRAIRGASR